MLQFQVQGIQVKNFDNITRKPREQGGSNGHMLCARQSQVSCANRLTMPVLRVSKFLIVIWVNNARTCNCYKSPFSLIILKQSADIKRNWIFPQSQMVISTPNRKYQKHEVPKMWKMKYGSQQPSQVAASDASSDCCFVPDHTEAFSAQQCLQGQRTMSGDSSLEHGLCIVHNFYPNNIWFCNAVTLPTTKRIALTNSLGSDPTSTFSSFGDAAFFISFLKSKVMNNNDDTYGKIHF